MNDQDYISLFTTRCIGGQLDTADKTEDVLANILLDIVGVDKMTTFRHELSGLTGVDKARKCRHIEWIFNSGRLKYVSLRMKLQLTRLGFIEDT